MDGRRGDFCMYKFYATCPVSGASRFCSVLPLCMHRSKHVVLGGRLCRDSASIFSSSEGIWGEHLNLAPYGLACSLPTNTSTVGKRLTVTKTGTYQAATYGSCIKGVISTQLVR